MPSSTLQAKLEQAARHALYDAEQSGGKRADLDGGYTVNISGGYLFGEHPAEQPTELYVRPDEYDVQLTKTATGSAEAQGIGFPAPPGDALPAASADVPAQPDEPPTDANADTQTFDPPPDELDGERRSRGRDWLNRNK